MVYYLYQITNLLSGMRYIGITCNPTHRWKLHCYSRNNSYISRSIAKYGRENFEFKILVVGNEDYIKAGVQ